MKKPPQQIFQAMVFGWWAFLICCVFSGCATTHQPYNWTSPAEVRTIIETTPKSLPQVRETFAPEEWEVATDQTITGHAPKNPKSPAELALVSLFKGDKSRVLSYTQTCAAREWWRAYTHSERKWFAPRVDRFVSNRCGAIGVGGRYAQLIRGGKSPFQPGRIEPSIKAWMEEILESQKDAPVLEFGILEAEWAGELVVVIVVQAPRILVEPRLMNVGGREVEFVGRAVSGSVERGFAVVTYGDHMRWCRLDPSTKPPQFKVICPLNPEDPYAYIDLYLAGKGENLGSLSAELMVSPSGEPPKVYKPSKVEEVIRDHEFQEAMSWEAQFVDGLNAVRKSAGLHPVVLAREQSKTASGLLPAMRSDDVSLSNRAYLGLKAGWDLGDARIVSFGTSTSAIFGNDVQEHLSEHLNHGLSRMRALSPDTDVVALGVGQSEGSTMVTFAVYGVIEDETIQARANKVFEAINAQRKELGRRPLSLRLDAQVKALDLIKKFDVGELDEPDVMEGICDFDGADECNEYWVESLNYWSMDSDILDEDAKQVAIGVSGVPLPNTPHWTYILWIVTFD